MNKESCQQAAQTPSSITVASGFSPVEVNAAFIASLVSHQQMVILINASFPDSHLAETWLCCLAQRS